MEAGFIRRWGASDEWWSLDEWWPPLLCVLMGAHNKDFFVVRTTKIFV
jgi:kynureninase